MHLFRLGRFSQGLIYIPTHLDDLFRLDLGDDIGLVVMIATVTAEISGGLLSKLLRKALLEVRNIASDGLFTAHRTTATWFSLQARQYIPIVCKAALQHGSVESDDDHGLDHDNT